MEIVGGRNARYIGIVGGAHVGLCCSGKRVVLKTQICVILSFQKFESLVAFPPDCHLPRV